MRPTRRRPIPQPGPPAPGRRPPPRRTGGRTSCRACSRNKWIYRWHDPEPGDVVMLYYPEEPEKSFVKRVMAKEGDTIRSEYGHVFVNEIPISDDFIPEEYKSDDSWGPYVVKKGYYWVMGDHRNNSSDSRIWGEVPKKYIIGKVQIRWWPLDHARIF
jgi:signal peptidase I